MFCETCVIGKQTHNLQPTIKASRLSPIGVHEINGNSIQRISDDPSSPTNLYIVQGPHAMQYPV